jgi:hypothetical protein
MNGVTQPLNQSTNQLINQSTISGFSVGAISFLAGVVNCFLDKMI